MIGLDASRFIHHFRESYGATPAEYRRACGASASN
jgi:hypothetical protein